MCARFYISVLVIKTKRCDGWNAALKRGTVQTSAPLRSIHSSNRSAAIGVSKRWCKKSLRRKHNSEHARAGAARVGGNAARVAGMSAGARMTKSQDANFDDCRYSSAFE